MRPAGTCRRIARCAVLAAAALAATPGHPSATACNPCGPMFTSPWEVDDPGYLSPRFRLYYGPWLPQLAPPVLRPVPVPGPLPGPGWAPMPLPGPETRPASPQPLPFEQPVPQPVPFDDPGGPAFGRPDEPAAPRLDLAVAAPMQAQAGSSVLFEIRVTNRGDAPAADVAIEATLDDGLRLPGRDETRVVRPLGSIPAGASREVALTLVGEQAGTHCAAFLATLAGREAGWKRICVEFVPRQLDISLTAPEEVAAGERARFVVVLTNVRERPIENVELLVAPDPLLRPVGGSAGARQTPEGLAWDLGRVAASERVEVEIECEALRPAERACLRARVTAEGLPEDSVEHCLEITAARNRARRELQRGTPPPRRASITGIPPSALPR